jgi:SAM-dependent methyltransferase
MVSLPPGHIARMFGKTVVPLGGASTADLANELLARLRGGERIEEGHAPVDLLAALSMEIEVRTDRFCNRFSREHACVMFHKPDRHVAAKRLKLEGATVVELGCGSISPWTTLFLFLLAGARHCVGVDLDPPQDPPSAARAVARLACNVLGDPRAAMGFAFSRDRLADRLHGFDLVKLWCGDTSGIDASRLQLLRERAEHLSLADGAADYVYSISFLEHVPDPDATIAEIARVTRPGGLSIHTIDGSDHRRYWEHGRHPLDFLTEAGGERMVVGSNRVRPLQFAETWRRHGFEVVDVDVEERVEVPDDVRARFLPPWRALPRDTLEAISVTMHLRKRDA